ncbi:hypothetical protein PENTCL1PPCAC_24878 [Pristionchus entomophagus]|uniref:S-formylglutathione hydrolase n=1 Tax=Pristionchus entomophagus TaxID=358040 RepID=A0AAV5U785_9BILA|nr:hypothetical protein PENTCL1PPCAC_24878 [Pristionchus entomophagus]
MTVEQVSAVRSFNGTQYVFKHKSESLSCEMTFGVYVPDHTIGEKLPGLLYLSGLTCTHANVMEKGGAQIGASKLRLIFIHPDTSPRGEGVPDADRYDLGQGAGFYIDATRAPWSSHFKMRSYIESELLATVASVVPALDSARVGITGHSMGGHGALTLGLSRPDLFRSISAFAPISHPTECAWGHTLFGEYLGDEAKEEWKKFDAAILLSSYSGPARSILVDQGTEDNFLKQNQLQPESLKSHRAATVELRMQSGYDHSYYFIATFMYDHIEHHHKQLIQ